MSQKHYASKKTRPSVDFIHFRSTLSAWIAEWLRIGALGLTILLAPSILPSPAGSDAGICCAGAIGDARQSPAEGDDDEDLDNTDDGSRSLSGKAGAHPPTELSPISPTEEKELLGDWGDSAEEAED